MQGERRDPRLQRSIQERALAHHVAHHVYPYSSYYRARFDEVGLGRNPPVTDLLRRLPLTDVSDLADSPAMVLRPDEATLQRFASPTVLVKIVWAKLTRRADHLNRTVIEPTYKPVQWLLADGVPIASSASDLRLLGDVGRRLLAHAGLGRYDVVASLVAPGPDLAYWQLVEGCRAAGLSAIHLGPAAAADDLLALAPTVVAGDAVHLERMLRSATRPLPGLHTLIVTGEPLDDGRRHRLAAWAPGVAVVGAWAPVGTRSLWVTCRGGTEYHTFPDVELIEVVDPLTGAPAGADGELVWSGIGWMGTALLRFRTGFTGVLTTGRCPTCGRTSPRVAIGSQEPTFVRVLDRAPEIAGWQAELRTVDGAEELIVHLALDGVGHPGKLLRRLDRELSATQYVVVDTAALGERLNDSGCRRVLDRRTGSPADHG